MSLSSAEPGRHFGRAKMMTNHFGENEVTDRIEDQSRAKLGEKGSMFLTKKIIMMEPLVVSSSFLTFEF
jgi:hypothetical protein